MVARLAVLALATAAFAQLLNLWPLPSEAAAQSMAFWAKIKSDAEAIDLSRSPRPESDAKAKAEIIQASDAVLANPDGLLLGARIHWALWFGSAALSALAGFALIRRWRYWPLLAVASAAMFFWLQQPLSAYRVFYIDGQFDLHHGVSQLEFMSQYPAHSGQWCWQVAWCRCY